VAERRRPTAAGKEREGQESLNQRRRRAWSSRDGQSVGTKEAVMAVMWKWKWWIGAGLVAAVAWMTLGRSEQPTATAAVIEDKSYTVTPAAIKVKAGIVTGDVTEMKVTERVEQGSGRVVSPAKLTAKVVLKNSSPNQTIRLVSGKIRYLDAQGLPIKLEETRTEPTLKFSTYGTDRLDPGQEATQSLDVDFPAEALKAKKLQEMRLELAYIPSPYHEETVKFIVAISGQ
jgi:hypothetical protein